VPTVARRGFPAALFAAGEEPSGVAASRHGSSPSERLFASRDCVGLNPRTLSREFEP
jgi:hypothetical protein